METRVYGDWSRIENTHWWFLARREILLHVVERYLPAGASILDVGCGTGFILEKLRRVYDVYGLDFAQAAVDECRAKGLTNVRVGELGVTKLDRDFDMVTLLDVIEHVDDDLAILEHARAALNKSGRLLVTVPAYAFLWSDHDVVHHHRRRYTKRELEEVVRRAGFEPEYTTYFNTVVFPVVFAARMLGRILPKGLKSGNGSDAQPHSNLVNRALYSAFASEKSVVPGMSLPFGVSILCVARVRDSAS